MAILSITGGSTQSSRSPLRSLSLFSFFSKKDEFIQFAVATGVTPILLSSPLLQLHLACLFPPPLVLTWTNTRLETHPTHLSENLPPVFPQHDPTVPLPLLPFILFLLLYGRGTICLTVYLGETLKQLPNSGCYHQTCTIATLVACHRHYVVIYAPSLKGAKYFLLLSMFAGLS